MHGSRAQPVDGQGGEKRREKKERYTIHLGRCTLTRSTFAWKIIYRRGRRLFRRRILTLRMSEGESSVLNVFHVSRRSREIGSEREDRFAIATRRGSARTSAEEHPRKLVIPPAFAPPASGRRHARRFFFFNSTESGTRPLREIGGVDERCRFHRETWRRLERIRERRGLRGVYNRERECTHP